MAEVLLDALSQVTGAPTQVQATTRPAWRAHAAARLERRTRTSSSRSAGPTRLITCECERTDEPSMVQVLHIANGDTINQKLQPPKTTASTQLLAAEHQRRDRSSTSCISSALSRLPTDDEQANVGGRPMKPWPAQNRRRVLEDLYWSVLSSKEFLFNH